MQCGMAGLRAGILAGRSSVISAMRTAAREAVNTAKKELKIKSPSQVFRDKVGVMTMYVILSHRAKTANGLRFCCSTDSYTEVVRSVCLLAMKAAAKTASG